MFAQQFSAWLILSTSLVTWAGVLIAQYGFGLPPCPLCWWQRWAWLAIGVLSVLSLISPNQTAKKMAFSAAWLGLIIGGAVAFWHSGIEYHWWRGPADCTGDLQTSDPEALLNALTATPTIRCDQAAWTFYGISLAGFNVIISWSLAIFLLFFRSESVAKSRSASK